MLHLFLLSI